MKIENWKLKIVRFWFPVLICAGFIFWLSSLPNLESGLGQDFILRKIAHILEYAILTFLLFKAFLSTGNQPRTNKILALAMIVAFLYALSDEYHQTFIFGRQGKLGDVGIDTIGILIMALLCYTKNIRGRN